MVERVVLVQRQSPPWAELARAQRSGLTVDPSAYMPPMPVPGFPMEVPRLIQAWNETFSLDYFTCRACLKEIASLNNRRCANTSHVSYDEFDALSDIPNSSLLFFHDDDDVFDTAIGDLLGQQPKRGFDVLVAPLIRFSDDLFTFVREGEATDLLLGRRQNFHFRYQTNNYGLHASRTDRHRFHAMKDHVEASTYADANGLEDAVISRPLSATLKTIWSASMLPIVDQGRHTVVEILKDFSNRAAELTLPDEYDWLCRCLDQICVLMRCVLAGESYEILIRKTGGLMDDSRPSPA